MTSGRTISYKAIIGRFGVDYPGYVQAASKEIVLETMSSVLKMANRPEILKKKYSFSAIVDGRGPIPYDLHHVISAGVSQENTIEEAMCSKKPLIPMLGMLDTMANQQEGKGTYIGHGASYTYELNNNSIIPNFTEGIVVFAYAAVPTDAQGFPEFPDDEPWILAGIHTIAERVAYIRFVEDPSTERIYDEVKWKAKKARQFATNYSKMPTHDQRQAMANINMHSIPNTRAHNSFFQFLQWPESRRMSGISLTDNYNFSYGGTE